MSGSDWPIRPCVEKGWIVARTPAVRKAYCLHMVGDARKENGKTCWWYRTEIFSCHNNVFSIGPASLPIIWVITWLALASVMWPQSTLPLARTRTWTRLVSMLGLSGLRLEHYITCIIPAFTKTQWWDQQQLHPGNAAKRTSVEGPGQVYHPPR